MDGEERGLVGLATELVHRVALSGWLEPRDVAALAQTCRRMADVLVWDGYGRDLHRALVGVMENVWEKRWRAARYAVRRRWFVGDGREVWRRVAEVVDQDAEVELVLAGEEEVGGWESVLLAALALPGASGCSHVWYLPTYRGSKTSLLLVAATVGSEKIADWVLERGGCDLEEDDFWGRTPFLLASTNGHLGVIERVVEKGANVGARDQSESSALLLASGNGHAEVVKFLLSLKCFHVEEQNSDCYTPLAQACSNGHLDVVKLLVEEGGADLDVEGEDEEGPPWEACRNGHVTIVEYLLRMGAWGDPRKDGSVWREGLSAAALDDHLDVVDMLLSVGCKPVSGS